MARVDRTKRKVIYEVLNFPSPSHASMAHQINWLANVYKEGLTPKEHAFLMARHDALEKEMKLMAKFRDHIKHSLS